MDEFVMLTWEVYGLSILSAGMGWLPAGWRLSKELGSVLGLPLPNNFMVMDARKVIRWITGF